MSEDIDGGDAYSQRIQRRKAIQDKRMARRSPTDGLIIVHTGAGKGKTTACPRMVLRSLGHGHRVAIVQFIKGAWEPAGEAGLRALGRAASISRHGRGLHLGDSGPGSATGRGAGGWEVALRYLADADYGCLAG